MDQIVDFIQYVALIAVGAERVTDILKRAYLEKKNVNSSVYQLITFACGIVLSVVQPPEFKLFNFDPIVVSILVGLAVSGGSSVWHDALSALNNFSKTLKAQASQTSAITDNLSK
jgi:hypothetical protein